MKGTIVAAVGAVSLLTAVAAGGVLQRSSNDTSTPAGVRAPAAAETPRGADALALAIGKAQQRLRQVPGDYPTWAGLGSAYVQQARITADPTYYPRAQAALDRSLAINRNTNYGAMVGQGALANARHDFAGARDWARRALAVNAYDAGAYAVLADALTQLGDYPGATAAVQRGLELKPGVSVFTRASYDLEIHGRPADAATALRRALDDSTGPADVAFCRYYLGELAFNDGRLDEAAVQYAAGIAVDPGNTPLLQGQAKVAAARGQTVLALGLYARLVSRMPLAQYLLEYGDYLTSLDRPQDAARQYALVRTEQRLLAANGVTDDLTLAQLDADHGDPAGALRSARAEWGRRHSVLAADALAWALHVNGRDAEALPYAQQANRLGWHNAVLPYHLGMIEAALHRDADARGHLTLALRTNPYFSPLDAPTARQALIQLDRR